MKYRCGICGKFVKRIRDAIGLPLSTGFPPDKLGLASTTPYAPFVCNNHGEFERVEYQPVVFQFN